MTEIFKYVDDLEIPFCSRYIYEINNQDKDTIFQIVYKENIIIICNYEDKTFYSIKFDEFANGFEFAGTHSKERLFDDKLYKDNHGINKNYVYKIESPVIIESFDELYNYICNDEVPLVSIEIRTQTDNSEQILNPFINNNQIIKKINKSNPNSLQLDYRQIINRLEENNNITTMVGTGYYSWDKFLLYVEGWELTLEESTQTIENILKGYSKCENLRSFLMDLYKQNKKSLELNDSNKIVGYFGSTGSVINPPFEIPIFGSSKFIGGLENFINN